MFSKRIVWVIFVSFGLALLGFSVPAGAKMDASENTAQIPENWLSQVKKNIEESEYYLSSAERQVLPETTALWQAPNRAHNFRTLFTEKGPMVIQRIADKSEWTWGLELVSVKCPISDMTDTGLHPSIFPPNTDVISVKDNWIEYCRGDYLSEWYKNDSKGLEQGFTLYDTADAPWNIPEQRLIEGDNASVISFDIAVHGNLIPIMTNYNQITFSDVAGKNVMKYGNLKVTDAHGKCLDANLKLLNEDASQSSHPYQMRITVDMSQAVFPVTIDPLAESIGWSLESNDAGAAMGTVSTAGDVNGDGYSDVIIGAHAYSSTYGDVGKVWVYYGSSTGLSSTPWTAVGADESDQQTSPGFGWAVNTAGDLNGDNISDIIVSAPFYDTDDYDTAGAVFVWYGSSTGLGASGIPSNADWKSTGLCEESNLGFSVSSAGDIIGNGYASIIVGGFGYYDNNQKSFGEPGYAAVWYGSSNGLQQSAPQWTMDDYDLTAVGWEVANAGDVDGDGYGDILVSVYTENQVYLWYGSSSGVSVDYDILSGSGLFGYSVATAGDINGDGYADVIIGAPHAGDYCGTSPGGYEGRILVYHGSSSGISTTANWSTYGKCPQGFYGQELGTRVGTAGDINGDGYADIFAKTGPNRDTTFVWYGSSTGLPSIENTDNAQWSGEGGGNIYFRVGSTAGDINGDGYSDLISGEMYWSNGQTNEGRAILYYGSGSGLGAAEAWSVEGNSGGAFLGYSVASAGDVNGDGYSDVMVGAYTYTSGQSLEGKVFAYYGTATGLPTTASWTAESNQANALFGGSVASAGDVNGDGYADVIVGAHGYTSTLTAEGAAFVYFGHNTGLSAASDWLTVGGQANAHCGASVASAGDVNGDGYSDVIIGTPGWDDSGANNGRIRVYYGLSSQPLVAYDEKFGANAGECFGSCVASAGDTNRDGRSDVIIGAPNYSNGQSQEGRVYVYYGTSTGIGNATVWTKEENQAGAHLGAWVAPAGDVDGNGYSDICIVAPDFDYPETGEGMVWVYYGSSSGLPTNPNWSFQGNQAGADLSVATTAGDVNGDGYSDFMVGMHFYDVTTDSGTLDAAGRVIIFRGSSSGLVTNNQGDEDPFPWIINGDAEDASIGASIASAGDVDGDGHADILIGQSTYTNGQIWEGRAFMYYGSAEGGLGKGLRPQQFRGGSAVPICYLGKSYSSNSVQLKVLANTPFGKGKVRLQCEVKPLGTAFDGSTGLTTGSWTSVEPGGTTLSVTKSSLSSGTVYHWRVRLFSSPASLPLQPTCTPWISIPWNSSAEGDFRAAS